MGEVCYAGSDLLNRPVDGNNIGGLTNIDEDEMPLPKKAKDMAPRDLIIIWDRPCKVVRTELLPTGLISFRCMDIFNLRGVTRRLDPDHICEVPLVSRADYLCTGVCDEKDSVILESDDGITRDDIKMPPSIVLRMQILFGLRKGREVIVTLVSSMGLERIMNVTLHTTPEPDKQRL
ncbi:hypothetical protein AALP_AA2G012600 [Arabis alpina]|uniref:Translation initiation factor 5A C-terminal domain-containing protein n=1 Tax=Arabis alpina TaxID=50452 RepID=A0A087HEL2_ARAAL|nr:hypothetical protein AALP_AA2G012600 [Arabis alpina]